MNRMRKKKDKPPPGRKPVVVVDPKTGKQKILYGDKKMDVSESSSGTDE